MREQRCSRCFNCQHVSWQSRRPEREGSCPGAFRLRCSSVTLCFRCVSDVDECSLGRSRCSSYATCYNTPGSYKCKCRDGFRGMGHDCKRKKPTDKNPAPPHSAPASGNGASPFLFAFFYLKMYGRESERGRNNLPSRRAGIPFFVGAVNQNPSLRCLVT